MAEEKDLKSKLEEAEQANIALNEYIEEIYDQLTFNQDQVDAYREQLLELSQSQDDVPEDKIQRAFQSVFDGVELWIDELSSQPGFDEHFARNFILRLREPKVENLLSEMTNNSGVDWMRVGHSQYCTYTIFSLVLGDFLERDVFRLLESSKYGHIYPYELRKEHMKVLSEVQHKMKGKEADGDIRASRWRREAVTALMVESDEERKLQNRIMRRLHNCLLRETGHSISTEQSRSLQAKVIDRALGALRMIAGSSKEYVFLGSNNKPGQYYSSSCEWSAIDIYSWRKRPRCSGKNGILKVLFPGLSREKDSRGPGGTLVSPTFLVDQPKSRTPSPRKSGIKTPTREPSGTEDAHSYAERSRRPPMPSIESRERTPTARIRSGDLFRGAESLVKHRHVKDFKNVFSWSSKDKRHKLVKAEEFIDSPKPAATFPAFRHHHKRSLTSGARRREQNAELEAEILHGREIYSQENDPPHSCPSVRTSGDPGVHGVIESYSPDPATWRVSEGYGQPSQARHRSQSVSY